MRCCCARHGRLPPPSGRPRSTGIVPRHARVGCPSPWCAGPRWPSTWTRRPTSRSSAAPEHTARRPLVDDGVRVLPLQGLPEVRAGDDLAAQLLAAASRAPVGGLRDGDVLVVTHKVVAKAEGCAIDLRTVEPSAFARAIAERWDKDARQVEVVLRESVRIVRMDRGVLICETRHGYVCANAGVDASNVGEPDVVCLQPVEPNDSAERLRAGLAEQFGVKLGVIVTDTFGRAWRNGVVNVAIGVAGLAPLDDYRGQHDPNAYELRATVLAVADELAAAAELVMGKLARRPVAIVRGFGPLGQAGSGRELVMDPARDMFR